MRLKRVGTIDLPENAGAGGFDHAAVHGPRGLLYVAHTANDALDVIDVRAGRYLRSIPQLKGVAGALVDERADLVFTSNRGEDTIGVLSADGEAGVHKIGVGMKPNGLALDPDRGLLLCANVGASGASDYTVTLVDVRGRTKLRDVPVPGRTRWTVYDPETQVFFVNIADPPRIVAIDASGREVAKVLEVPARGPHGLDLDSSRGRLYCACDDGKLIGLDSRSGQVVGTLDLSGGPDVIFLNRSLGRLYVAIGEPGVIDVVDVTSWRRVETVPTGRGAHTIGFDATSNRIYAFLPEAHCASVYEDGTE